MLQHLVYKIKATGPITVAEYMKEVLTNPAKVCAWVGEPTDQARPRRFARCEPGRVRVDQSPSVFCPDRRRGPFQRKSHPTGPEDGYVNASWSGLGQVSGSATVQETHSRGVQETV